MSPQNQPNSTDYDPSTIIHLEPREHVRMRPGMYIGGTDKRALHHMVGEVLDDAISEFENTTYNGITISLLPDKTICIADNGRGISVNPHETLNVSWLEAYLSNIGRRAVKRHAAEDLSQTYQSFFGIGVPIVNALSASFVVEVKRDGFLWRQTYSQGLPTSKVEQIRPLESGETTGTSINFKPDFSILEENDFNFEFIANRCQELAYLLPQLRFTVVDKREEEHEISFYYPQGLIEWVTSQAETQKPVSELLRISHTCELMTKWDDPYQVKVELAFQWFEGDISVLKGYVNLEDVRDGGYHLQALEFALKKYLKVRSWNKIKHGLLGIIHILHPDPQFQGSGTYRLVNTDVYTAVDEAIEALFAAHPEAKAAIQNHFNQS